MYWHVFLYHKSIICLTKLYHPKQGLFRQVRVLWDGHGFLFTCEEATMTCYCNC